ncbi:MAG: acetyltransferase [Gammaproteobacteria bacterium]|nr:acetyltransferase [Gammaproteobacteria bacterium]
MAEHFLVFGAGGHAKVVIASLLSQGLSQIKIFDDSVNKIKKILLGYSVLGARQELLAYHQTNKKARVLVAIGANQTRQKIYQELRMQGMQMGQAIHADAIVASGVILGGGLMMMARAVINPDAKIGDNVIINTGAIIEHDCVIGDHGHVAPGAVLCGGVTVGELTLIGAGAIILPGVKIGSSCIIGAGAVVTQDLPDGKVSVGIPARFA